MQPAPVALRPQHGRPAQRDLQFADPLRCPHLLHDRGMATLQ